MMQGFATQGARRHSPLRVAVAAAALMFFPTMTAMSQVFTVGPEQIGGHYLEFHPTHVDLPSEPLTPRGRQELIRFLTAEHGFAMRPLPLASKGVTLHANGDMQPTGSDYINELNEHGTSAKPGDRCIITDVSIKENKIVFLLNGGPDHKHKWMRHISLGTDPNYTTPIAQDSGQEPVGSRITLVFAHDVPDVSGQQVEALLAPVLGFGVKSPTVAYTDTLPPMLKQAILDHHVLVGMSTEMVIHAMGTPQQKVREQEGQMPFEEWIYGEAPKPVEFVRINGNRVIRVETAEVGKPPVIRADNEMGNYWNTVADPNVHIVKLGDEDPAEAAKQTAPQAPPSLRKPGETLPTDDQKDRPTMQPVQFPTGMGKDSDQQKPAPPMPTTTTTTTTTTSSPSPQGTSGSAPQQYVASGSTPHS
ncbi:hypothetical protein [Acidobacterium sp. S8]|uniref:hypothetical protein n=1 Tax=Acidobacterium sp. S8 TaxID=1641854 RepID=UPI00131C0B13|nr:hypothetical protein [Acidobacterium sp. S8]